jgi:hypothetical protein
VLFCVGDEGRKNIGNKKAAKKFLGRLFLITLYWAWLELYSSMWDNSRKFQPMREEFS